MNGPYLPTNASKAGLLDETREFLLTYARLGDRTSALRSLVDSGLQQRSRETRTTIAKVIRARLLRSNPPDWVLGELAEFAQASDTDALKSALLLHTVRQDALLYDFVHQVIVSRWSEHQADISRADVQRFLDLVEQAHGEIAGWSRETREKLTGNALTILRDYGLLTGTQVKWVVEPIVPLPVAAHLARLLTAEGLRPEELAQHPDWRIWLWDAERAARVLAQLPSQEQTRA